MNIHFSKPELNWLQSNLQGWGEEKWPGSVKAGWTGGVGQLEPLEHQYLQNFLNQVRACIMNPKAVVSFDPPAGMGPAEHQFFQKWLIDYKGNAGEYIFQGPYGENIQEGGQFPDGTGSANQNFTAQGAFPENSFYIGANIFNTILQKLGAPQTPPIIPFSSSPGGGASTGGGVT